MVWAYLCAESAAYALGFIHACKTVPHDYSVLRTYLCAVPEAETAVGADFRAVVETVCRLAGLYSVKYEFAFGCVAVAVTEYYRHLRSNGHLVDPHYFGYFFGAFRAARLAHICGNAVMHHGGGIVRAAGKSAGAAVYLRESLVYVL